MFEVLFLIFSNAVIFTIIVFSFMIIVPINMLRHIVLSFDISEYLYTLLKGLDQLGGSIIYGTEDYTISSWTYYLYKKKGNIYAKYFMALIDGLAMGMSYILYKLGTLSEEDYLWNKNHCQNSFIDETKTLYEKGKSHME